MHPGLAGRKITCKGGLFFLLHLNGLPHLPEVPHLHVNRPLEISCKCNQKGKGVLEDGI